MKISLCQLPPCILCLSVIIKGEIHILVNRNRINPKTGVVVAEHIYKCERLAYTHK